jgi:hypothetical protein
MKNEKYIGKKLNDENDRRGEKNMNFNGNNLHIFSSSLSIIFFILVLKNIGENKKNFILKNIS